MDLYIPANAEAYFGFMNNVAEFEPYDVNPHVEDFYEWLA
jgi:hypothetical protein